MSVTDITGPIGDEGEFFVTYAMIVEKHMELTTKNRKVDSGV